MVALAQILQIANFDYFREFGGNKEFKTAFDEMQRIYVFDELYKLIILHSYFQIARDYGYRVGKEMTNK